MAYPPYDPNTMFYDPNADPSQFTPTQDTSVQTAPWWQGPPPPGYTGQWPPPLPPGGSYGPNFGQVNYAQAPVGSAPQPGAGYYWDPTQNGGQGGWSNTGNSPVSSAPGVYQYTGASGAPTPSGTGSSVTGGGTGAGSYTGGGLPSPFTSTFTPPQMLNLGGPSGVSYVPPTPSFTPPGYTPPPAFSYQAFQAPAPFHAPTAEEAAATPGFQFALGQGLGAINNSEAARGLWASGATGKALQDYAQNYAGQFYGDIYNRDLNTYNENFQNALQSYLTNAGQAMNQYATNAQTQYLQPYNIAFQNAQASFAPQMQGYQNLYNAATSQNQQNYVNSYQKWLDDFNQKFNTAQYLLNVQKA